MITKDAEHEGNQNRKSLQNRQKLLIATEIKVVTMMTTTTTTTTMMMMMISATVTG